MPKGWASFLLTQALLCINVWTYEARWKQKLGWWKETYALPTPSNLFIIMTVLFSEIQEKKTENHSPASFENSSQWHNNSLVKRKYKKWINLHPFCQYIVSCLMADFYVCYFSFWFFLCCFMIHSQEILASHERSTVGDCNLVLSKAQNHGHLAKLWARLAL